MDLNVNVGSKIKETLDNNKSSIRYVGDIVTAGIVCFCIGYVKCLGDIIKHSPHTNGL